MVHKQKKILYRAYATCLFFLSPLYKSIRSTLVKRQHQNLAKRVVLLISRPQDIELLVGLHEKARSDLNLQPCFWLLAKCVERHPEVFDELSRYDAEVEMVINYTNLATALKKFVTTDIFMTTVESTTARHKLPFLLTKLANAIGLSTFTMQHGFENIGLTYRDETHGPEVTFAAKKVLIWGPAKELPDWVGAGTREKCVAVGCPKKMVIPSNDPSVKPGDRPLIGVFDNLHWQRYNETYLTKFLDHLEETALQRPDLHFVLKSHPESVRKRSEGLSARLSGIENVEIADMHGEDESEMTTPMLMAKATGVITTPSTIALDGALARIPVAVSRYGLDLDYYVPLRLLDDLEDWLVFLKDITDQSGRQELMLQGEQFLDRVLVSGDPAAQIVSLMVASVAPTPARQ